MKKLIAICSLSLLAMATKVSAQQFVARLTTVGGQPVYVVPNAEIKDGETVVVVIADEAKRLEAKKAANGKFRIVFLDSLGSRITMNPTTGGAKAGLVPNCKPPMITSCYSTPDGKVEVCICAIPPISSGGSTSYTIAARITGLKQL